MSLDDKTKKDSRGKKPSNSNQKKAQNTSLDGDDFLSELFDNKDAVLTSNKPSSKSKKSNSQKNKDKESDKLMEELFGSSSMTESKNARTSKSNKSSSENAKSGTQFFSKSEVSEAANKKAASGETPAVEKKIPTYKASMPKDNIDKAPVVKDSKPAIKSSKPVAKDSKPVSKNTFSDLDGLEGFDTVTTPSLPPISKKKRLLRLFILACFVIGGGGLFFIASVISVTPKVDPNDLYSYLNSSSVLYDDEGRSVGNIAFSEGSRVIIEYEDIPENMVNAIVAIEDKTFWEHSGFNFVRIAGAVLESIFGGGDVAGTSTLTQQLARNVYLTETMTVRSYSRKISEAYYSVIIETALTKEEIVEAYLNTVFLGYGSYGIEAASQAYYSKPAGELDLLECASLAAIPSSPTSNALVQQVDLRNVDSSLEPGKILDESANSVFLYNGDASLDRRNLVLSNMHDQGYIDKETLDATLAIDLRTKIKPVTSARTTLTSYFGDYVIAEVTDDLIAAGYEEESVQEMIYGGGLHIYTTMSRQAQSAALAEFEEDGNYPSLRSISYDSNDNILDDYGNVILTPLSQYVSNDTFTLTSSEYALNEDGSMTVYKEKRLKFYETTVNGALDYSVEFKPMYVMRDGDLHTIETGYILIPQEYKTLDADGNLVIDSSFFADYPDFFVPSGSNLSVVRGNFFLQQEVIQPQAAIVISDYKTGQIKAMVGGRGITGSLLYNRAINPRQPGSSIKSIGPYAGALQLGANAVESGSPMTFAAYDEKDYPQFFGEYWTAASYINDQPIKVNGQDWPKNSYSGYRGEMTMRSALAMSSNAASVRIYNHVTPNTIMENLKKMGVTTIDEVNDLNASALALGGMTRGISPLEMTGAYSTIGNDGVYIEPISYTKVLDSQGNVLLETPKQDETEVFDAGVAYIVRNMMRSVVTGGTGGNAQISGVEVIGKTGTTDSSTDIWFCGLTPQYAAAVWIGADINIPLTSTSYMAAGLWSEILEKAIEGVSGSYPARPSNVVSSGGEYFISGTQGGTTKPGPEKDLCMDSGYVATPLCTNVETFILEEDDAFGDFYCYLHNNGTFLPIPPGFSIPGLPEPEPDPEDPDPEDPDPPVTP